MSDFVLVELLGDYATPDCNLKALFVSGRVQSLKYFANESEYVSFRDELSNLKGLIGCLNYKHRHGLLSDVEYRRKLRNHWLEDACVNFIMMFGACSVPADVRASIDEVSAELDTTIVGSWPPTVLTELYRTEGVFHIHFVAESW